MALRSMAAASKNGITAKKRLRLDSQAVNDGMKMKTDMMA